MKQQICSFIAGGNAKLYNHFLREFGSLTKLNIVLAYDPATLLGIYPTDPKIMATKRFMAVLFIIGKIESNQDVLQQVNT